MWQLLPTPHYYLGRTGGCLLTKKGKEGREGERKEKERKGREEKGREKKEKGKEGKEKEKKGENVSLFSYRNDNSNEPEILES